VKDEGGEGRGRGNYKLQITNYELRITSYELRITNRAPMRVAGRDLRAGGDLVGELDAGGDAVAVARRGRPSC